MGSDISPSAPSRAQWLRRLASRRRDRVAFVLSGGGPLGALQVGALRALLETGVRPDLVVGTSVGALNATFIAFNPTPEGVGTLESVWRGLDEHDIFPGGRFRASWARMFVRGNRIFENSGLRTLIRTRLGEARFEDAQIPLGVVATDLETGDETLFTTGDLIEPIIASCAMPGVFPPVTIGDRAYTDGGIANNVPIAPAVEMGAKTIYVLNSTSHMHQRRPLLRPMDYFFHAFTLARSQRLALDRKIYSDKVNLVMLPAADLDFFVPFASMEHTDRLIDIGYEQAKAFLTGKRPVATTETDAVEVIAPSQ